MTASSSDTKRHRLRLIAAILPAIALVGAAFLIDAAHHAAARSAKVSDRARLAAGTVDLQLGRLLELTRFCATSPDLLDRVDVAAVADSCGRYAEIIGAWVEVVVPGPTRQVILSTHPDARDLAFPFPAPDAPEALLMLDAQSRQDGGPVVSHAYEAPGSGVWTLTGGQRIRLADGRAAMVHVNLPAAVLSEQLAEIASVGDPLIGLIDPSRRIVARSASIPRPLFTIVPALFQPALDKGGAGAQLSIAGPEAVGGVWDIGYHPLHAPPGWMTVAVRPVPGILQSWTLVSVPSTLVLVGLFLSGVLIWFVGYRQRIKARVAAAELARAEADRASRDKSRLLASFAHDIRTPLISLIGSLELLQIGAVPGSASRGIATACGSAETLLQMVDDILELSFLGSGTFRLNPSLVDLRRLASDLVDQSRGVAEDKALTLRLELDEALPPAVEVDRLRLQQALSNLLSNAIKYTNQGMVVLQIKAGAIAAGSTTVTFSVADTGVGLANEDIPKILREFGRLDREAERQVQGVGLGLAIVQRILRAMGSHLTIESAVGQGSIFGFTLSLPVPSAAPAADAAAPLAGLTIIYAEDEPVIRMVTSRRLSTAGARVIEAVDGLEAIEQIAKATPDLLLLDLHMPRLDGVGVIRQLQAATSLSFPVFVLTAHIAGPEADAAAAGGADEVFTKPIQIEALAAAYRAWRNDCGRARPMGGVGPHAAGSPHLDAETFRSVITEADTAFSAKLMKKFRSEMQADIAELRRAMAAGDADSARALAHKGLGICQVLGAVRLGKILRAIEDSAAKGDVTSVAHLSHTCAEALEFTIAEMEAAAGPAMA